MPLPTRAVGRRSLGARDVAGSHERGVSSLELVIYFPLLMLLILLTVQMSFVYLGNQAAAAAARQAERVAKVTFTGTDAACGGSSPEAEANGRAYGEQVGRGLLSTLQVEVDYVPIDGVCSARAVATGTGIRIVPGWPGSSITKVAQGPVEVFRGDG